MGPRSIGAQLVSVRKGCFSALAYRVFNFKIELVYNLTFFEADRGRNPEGGCAPLPSYFWTTSKRILMLAFAESDSTSEGFDSSMAGRVSP